MSATVPVYVKVEKVHTEIIMISALTRSHAEEEALCLPGVIRIVESSYEEIK